MPELLTNSAAAGEFQHSCSLQKLAARTLGPSVVVTNKMRPRDDIPSCETDIYKTKTDSDAPRLMLRAFWKCSDAKDNTDMAPGAHKDAACHGGARVQLQGIMDIGLRCILATCNV